MGIRCAWHMQQGGPGSDRQTILGTLQRTLAEQGIFPLPRPETYRGSVKDVENKLASARRAFCRAAQDFSLRHSRCEPLGNWASRLGGAFYDELEFEPLVRLNKSQRASLKRKREESGVSA